MNHNDSLLQLLLEGNSRVSDGDTWLVKESMGDNWVVRQQPYRAKVSRCLYSGTDLNEAIQAFREATNAS